jgi:hypothetical protein
MRPDPDGAWCEYDEVAAEIERLRRLWDSTDAELRARDKLAISQQAKIERLRKEVEAKDLLLSEWLGEDKAQLEIERLRRLVAEKEAQLSQIPCRYNRCVQYDDAKNEIVRLRAQLVVAHTETKEWIDRYNECETPDERDDEIARLRKELNRTRDAVDLWADKAIEYKHNVSSLLDLLRDANKIDEGDFSVNVDEWFARVRKAVERG